MLVSFAPGGASDSKSLFPSTVALFASVLPGSLWDKDGISGSSVPVASVTADNEGHRDGRILGIDQRSDSVTLFGSSLQLSKT